jgi:hypothetical protein
MNDVMIRRSILDILSAVRWQERRDGSPCHVTRDNALRVVLGLLNRVSEPSRFTNTRRALFRLMNEAKKNL